MSSEEDLIKKVIIKVLLYFYFSSVSSEKDLIKKVIIKVLLYFYFSSVSSEEDLIKKVIIKVLLYFYFFFSELGKGFSWLTFFLENQFCYSLLKFGVTEVN